MISQILQLGDLRLHFRFATARDLDRLVKIGDDALGADFVMDEFFYPRRHKYPAEFHDACVKSMKRDLQMALTWIVCADVEMSTSAPSMIGDQTEDGAFETVGWAIWSRESSAEDHRGALRSTAHMGLPDSYALLSTREKYSLWAYNLSISEFYRGLCNPAASLPHLMAVQRNSKDEYLDPGWKDPLNYWHLQQLNVLKRYQRRGIGSALVEWGLGFARRERLPVMLISTPEGRRLYENSGFVRYGNWKWKKGEAWAQMIWYGEFGKKAGGREDQDDGGVPQVNWLDGG